MNRAKTKQQIKEMKRELKAANRKVNVRLLKLAVLLFIILTVAAFMYPSPIRGTLRQWVNNTFNISLPK